MEGKLIVFEGVEGSGKSTQIRRLNHWLQTHPGMQQLQKLGQVATIVMTREPGGTPLGQQLRSLLLHQEAAITIGSQAELLMYAADRAQHVETVIRPALQAGSWVLCDRFTDSTVAYQGYGRSLDRSVIDQLNQIATRDLAPHLTLWLKLEAEQGLARSRSRGELDRMEQADITFHRRVQAGFEALSQQYPERIVAIAADQPEAIVAQQIQAVIEDRLHAWYGTHL